MFVRNKKKFSLNSTIINRKHKLSYIIEKKNRYQHKLKILKKLHNFYNGSILFPNNDDKFLNLSNNEFTQPPTDFLNFGPTCYLFKGFNPRIKLNQN